MLAKKAANHPLAREKAKVPENHGICRFMNEKMRL
jgi:hypothetical protein